MRPWGRRLLSTFPGMARGSVRTGIPWESIPTGTTCCVNRTPADHRDKAFELRFADGISHVFAADGSSSNIRGPDGYTVDVGGGGSSLPWAGMTLPSDPDTQGPVAAEDRAFGVDVRWSRGAVSGLVYRLLGTSTSFAVSVTRDQEKGITEVSKQGELAESGSGSIVNRAVSWSAPTPIRTYEQSVTGAGGGRTIRRSVVLSRHRDSDAHRNARRS